MPRTLLISRENGDDLKTYGVKKVRTTMKFPFIIGIGLVCLWCSIKEADSKILNEHQYLEYLNDLDRRNVEFDDIHEQWPFVNRAPLTHPKTGLVVGTNPLEESTNRDMVAETILSRKLSNSKNNKYFLDKLLHLGDGFQHMRDAADRADQIAQYRRQPLDPEYPPIRIYSEPVEEEETKYHQDEKAYHDDDNSENEDEELSELRLHHQAPIYTSFPRIVIENIYDQKFDNSYTTDDTDGEDEEERIREEDLEDRIPIPKPTFSPSFFPRLVAPDFQSKFNLDDFLGSKEKDKQEMHNSHDDYTFKEGEQFPQTIDFDKIPLVENPNEFAVKPADPRFYREIVQTEDTITIKPMHSPVHSYILDTPSVISKPKMNSRSDLHQQQESLPDEELQLESFVNKDVEMVPFKPNSEEDTAGVYIIAIVAGISAAATVGLTAVAIGWYKFVSGRRRNGLDGCIDE
ncbi:uncharacterized protein [Euwallacea fornicatus]|uniref:uncharacterized protein isoform X2 n=1 Tax=Euwallacea fornicatus TaxID=995702 RepID=UPI00338FFE67